MKINLMTIFRESADEIRKVVWLNKAEQLKKNLAVIGLVSVMTLLIWGRRALRREMPLSCS